MANPFLSSEEYDERAHRMYDNGDYEGALETLKEGIQLYPHSVELYVGLGYTRLAREEYVWARQDFERALVLDGEHEDALVGIGEVMLRFGRRHEALAYFERARLAGCADDLDLLLSMGRALYRERMFEHAREVFVESVREHRDSAEALAALGYTLHRLSDETGARRELRSALELDAELYEARIYLAHLLYDAGDWGAALRESRLPPRFICPVARATLVWPSGTCIVLAGVTEAVSAGVLEGGIATTRIPEARWIRFPEASSPMEPLRV